MTTCCMEGDGDFAPRVGKKFSAVIHRIDEKGNGIIETRSDRINVGPVTEDAVGEYIEAHKLPGGYARLNSKNGQVPN